MLAARAVIGAAPRLANLSDHAITTQARLAGPVVHPGLNLEATGPAVAVHVIADAAAASGDSIGQRLANRRNKDFVARPADPVRRPQWRDTGAEKAFRSIDVADADHQMAVHQDRLDRPAAPGERGMQPVWRETVGQWLDALTGQQ